ncbi:hypothetical protein DIPPA_25545 [Diplonema papillatum]|nr:hypothetical protein DIPPA_25545 [Diplonema papillatum]
MQNSGPPVAPEPEDPDVILLSHVWFRKKRTGEEFSRKTHGIFFSVLMIVFLLQVIIAVFPSMFRENAVGKQEQRCMTGCFTWRCGSLEGSVGNDGACDTFNLTLRICKAMTAINLIAVGIAMIIEGIELTRPGGLSVRYRYAISPIFFIAGLSLFIVALALLVVWGRKQCGLVISDGYQLSYGWALTTIDSVLLFFMSYCTWTGNRLW